ncbi:MAG: hypothetical protein R3Y24_15645 [Eubacteriales bacterium]
MKRYIFILCIAIIIVILSIVFCYNYSSKEKKVISTLEYIFHAPPTKIAIVYEEMYKKELSSNRNLTQELEVAVLEWGSGMIEESVLNDYSSTFYGQIIALMYARTVEYDIIIEPQTIEVEQIGENQFVYTANLKTNVSESEMIVSGNVQVNQEMLVNYMTCDFLEVFDDFLIQYE